jgi:hypothetical protein
VGGEGQRGARRREGEAGGVRGWRRRSPAPPPPAATRQWCGREKRGGVGGRMGVEIMLGKNNKWAPQFGGWDKGEI